MTPDTALAIYRGCCEDEDGDWQREAMRRIIRDAENNALERAALRITRDHSWALAVSADQASQCARVIRALKHV